MKKVVFVLMFGILLIGLTGCSFQISDKKDGSNYTEEIVENAFNNYGFESNVNSEKGSIDIDKYSTIKNIAQQLEKKIIENNIKINDIEIGSVGDKIKVNYNFSDESFLLIWFNESETINSITYSNQNEDSIRVISHIVVGMNELNFSEEDKDIIKNMNANKDTMQLGNWNVTLVNDMGKYVFQILEIN